MNRLEKILSIGTVALSSLAGLTGCASDSPPIEWQYAALGMAAKQNAINQAGKGNLRGAVAENYIGDVFGNMAADIAGNKVNRNYNNDNVQNNGNSPVPQVFETEIATPRMVHEVTLIDGQKGIDFYVTFNVTGHKGDLLEADILLYDREGRPYKNPSAHAENLTKEGQVGIILGNFLPSFDRTTYENRKMGKSYEYLRNLIDKTGTYNIQLQIIDLSKGTPRVIGSSEFQGFNFNRN